jgi:hypothetical protein
MDSSESASQRCENRPRHGQNRPKFTRSTGTSGRNAAPLAPTVVLPGWPQFFVHSKMGLGHGISFRPLPIKTFFTDIILDPVKHLAMTIRLEGMVAA